MASQSFRAFLGAPRWERLAERFRAESVTPLARAPFFILAAVVLLLSYALVICRTPDLPGDSVRILLLITTVGGVLWIRLPDRKGAFGEFSVVHTAFALGVVPALVLILFFRDSFVQGFVAQSGNGAQHVSFFEMAKAVLMVSLFAAVTEEVLFRGLLLSALRRLWANNWWRDLAAVFLSGLLFGAFHAILWGPMVGIALIGVGCGLGLGYVASGERLLTVILYHFLFDLLSLIAAILLRG